MSTLLELLRQALALLVSNLGTVLAIGLAAFLFSALIAPIGTLRWWSQRFRLAAAQATSTAAVAPALDVAGADHYVVYLSGVGGVSGNLADRREEQMLAQIIDRLPQIALIADIFAYSIENEPLTGERLLGGLWRWLHTARQRGNPFSRLAALINLRNMIQVAISADTRYGPLYNYGMAELIVRALIQHGYRLGSGTPITLLGYSGGAQVALGASRYLRTTLRAPVQVVAVGGVLASDPALEVVDRVVQIVGTRDHVQRVAGMMFPGRWPVFAGSRWNRALRQGKVLPVSTGPMEHAGCRSYFDQRAGLADGRTYLDHTVTLVCNSISAFH